MIKENRKAVVVGRFGRGRDKNPGSGMGRSLLPALLCLLPVGLAPAAEALPDPTRPPAEASIMGGGGAVPAGGPVLQSVLIGPGRKSAVIGGQLLEEGDLFGDAKVVKISEGEVILSGPGGEQTLRLFPGVEKKPAPLPEPVSPGAVPKREKNKSKRNTSGKYHDA